MKLTWKTGMAAVLIFGFAAAALPSQERYDFLDGFSLYFDDPGYAISDVYVTEAREDGIEIITPDGSTVYAFIVYAENTVDTDIKGVIIHELRNLYREDIGRYTDETIIVNCDSSGLPGTDAYWTELTLDYGEYSYYTLTLDLSNSPGTAEIMIFSFPPFFGLTWEEQYDILQEMFDELMIEFHAAAG